jgi:hypothetical protein
MTGRKSKAKAMSALLTAADISQPLPVLGHPSLRTSTQNWFPYEVYMKLDRIALTLLAATLLLPAASSAFAQDAPKPAAKPTAKQDLDKAGTDTKDATKKTGHAIAKGTKTAAKDTGKGTKTAAKDTAKGTETAAKDTAKGADTVGKDTAKGAKKIVHPLTKGSSKDAPKTEDKTTTPQ